MAFLVSTLGAEPSPETQAARIFKRFDADSDGYLSKGEYERIRARSASEFIFWRTDTDRDGRLSRAEVTTLLQGYEAAGGAYQISRNIAYGSEHERQKLDVYSPEGDGDGLPVMIFVHGGGWSIGDKRGVGSKPQHFTDNGFVFVSINYRLGPEFIHPVLAEDVAAAVVWVHEHIDAYGGDPERIYLMGHSAGAHLAALVSIDPRHMGKVGSSPDIIDGTILLDGAGYDVPKQIESAGPWMRRTYRKAFTDDIGIQRDASPITHVEESASTPPFLIIHVVDRDDARDQSNALAAALQNAGHQATVKSAENKNHMTLNRELGEPGDLPTQWVDEFIGAGQ